jgi:putative peptidoglycan lipid II flippase
VTANFLFITLTLSGLQHRAIALATSLSMILNFVFLSVALYYKMQGYPLKHPIFCLIKICLAAGIMGVSVYLLAGWLHPFSQSGMVSRLLVLVAVMAAGLLVYALVIHGLRIPEFQELISQVKRFRNKK